MIDRDSPVTEHELHAYVDGEIPADRRNAVEAWLGSHPEHAARVAHWRAQADAIRARYDAIASEPAPASEPRTVASLSMKRGNPGASSANE